MYYVVIKTPTYNVLRCMYYVVIKTPTYNVLRCMYYVVIKTPTYNNEIQYDLLKQDFKIQLA